MSLLFGSGRMWLLAVARVGCVLQISTEWEMNTENVMEWKLVDVPELGYYTTDKPFPRGELVLKTRGLISGYYKHPKARTHVHMPERQEELGVQVASQGLAFVQEQLQCAIALVRLQGIQCMVSAAC